MTVSPSLARNPDIDRWIRFDPDHRITIRPGKVELGQGIHTALAVIAAEELDLSLDQVSVAEVATDHSPDEGYTAGSASLEDSGGAIRQVAAEVRRILLQRAAEHLEVPVSDLVITKGVLVDPATGRSVTYWDFVPSEGFQASVSGSATPKTAAQHRLKGTAKVAIGLEKIVTGAPHFVHDMELPDMLRGRVLRPPNYLARLEGADLDAASRMEGVVRVVRNGSFVGVVAEGEYQAVKASDRLAASARWTVNETLDASDIFRQLRELPRTSYHVIDGVARPGPVPPEIVPTGAATTLQATYERPYQMHASIGPSAAVAAWTQDRVTVWTHSQGVYPLRANLAHALGVPKGNVSVIHVPGAGCYGHNGADDVALDAALLSRPVAPRPVKTIWMREQEHAWEPYGSAMTVDLQASLHADGHVTAWNHDTYSDTHNARPGEPTDPATLLASRFLSDPAEPPEPTPNLTFHGGIHRNADPLYAFPKRRIVKHFVSGLPLRTSAARSLGAYANVFAIESFMDELALVANADPLEFRLAHLDDSRAREVLETAATTADWGRPRAGETGRGLAFAQYKNSKAYAAVVVELEVGDYGDIELKRVSIAADAGEIVDPQGLRNQLEGGFLQSASWTLKERVTYNSSGITSNDWETYPILSFPEVPEIVTVLVDRPDQPYLGAGEAVQGPAAAAIANAVFDATSLRLRRIPFTPEAILAVAAAQ